MEDRKKTGGIIVKEINCEETKHKRAGNRLQQGEDEIDKIGTDINEINKKKDERNKLQENEVNNVKKGE